MKGKRHMAKKNLEMHYTTIQTLQESDAIPRFLSSLQEKFTETAGTSHEIKQSCLYIAAQWRFVRTAV